MKNTLWFLYKPQDERERELFYHAYARSFNFLVAALLILIMVLKYAVPVSIQAQIINVYLVMLIIISYYLGWRTLQKEEIIVDAQFSSRLPSPYIVWGILGGIGVLYLITMFVISYHKMDSIKEEVNIVFTGVWMVAVRLLAWFSTNKLQLPARVGLVLAFPLFTVLLSRTQGKTIRKRVMKSGGWYFLIIILIVAAVTTVFVVTKFRGNTFSIRPTTSVFEPVLKKDVSYPVWPLFIEGEDPNGSIKKGIFIVYRTLDRLMIGKVLEDSYTDAVVISNEDGQVINLSRKEIIGSIIFMD